MNTQNLSRPWAAAQYCGALAAAASLAALTACSGQSGVASAHVAMPAQPATERVTHKPNAVAALQSYQLSQTPQVGQPLDVSLRFEPAPGEAVQVRYGATAGLQIQSQPTDAALPSGPSEQRVRVLATSPGTAYLQVFVSNASGANAAHSVAIITDANTLPAGSAAVQKAADGERLIIVPVR